MKKFSLISLSILLFVVVSCPRKPAYEAGFEIPEGTKRDVEVLYTAPAGGTEALAEVHEIMVSFNQPMVPLEGVPEFEKDGPLKIEPGIKGRNIPAQCRRVRSRSWEPPYRRTSSGIS
jgi:hypothetical protein